MNQKKLISKSIQLPADVWEFVNDLANAEERSTSYIIRHIIGEFIRNDFENRIISGIEKVFGHGHDADIISAYLSGDTALHLWAILDDLTGEYTQAEKEETAILRVIEQLKKDEELRKQTFSKLRENVYSKESLSSVLRMYDKPYFKGTDNTKLSNTRGE